VNRAVATRVLATPSHTVVTASDGQEVLAAVVRESNTAATPLPAYHSKIFAAFKRLHGQQQFPARESALPFAGGS